MKGGKSRFEIVPFYHFRSTKCSMLHLNFHEETDLLLLGNLL